MADADYNEHWEVVNDASFIERVKRCFVGTESNAFSAYDFYKTTDAVDKSKFHYIVRIYAGRNGDGVWTSYLQDMGRIFEAINTEFERGWLIEWKNNCLSDTSVALIGIRDK